MPRAPDGSLMGELTEYILGFPGHTNDLTVIQTRISRRFGEPRGMDREGLTGIDADAGFARHLQCSRRLRLRLHHGQFERDAFSRCPRPLQGSIPINPATAKRPTDGGAFLSSEGLTGIEPA